MKSPLNEFENGKFEFCGIVFSRDRFDLRELYPEADNLDGHNLDQSLLPNAYKGQIRANIEKLLFLPDLSATYKFERENAVKVNEERYRYQLSFMKGLLFEDFLPAQLIMGVDESEPYECGETEFYGYLDYGKIWLIELIASLKYEKAMPELRELALHDADYLVKETAINGIKEIGGNDAAKTLCDVIKDVNIELSLRETAAKAIYNTPHNESVPILRDAIEETRNMAFEYFYETGNRMPKYALSALGQIPTLDSLEVINAEINKGKNLKPMLIIDYDKKEVRVVNEELYVRKKQIAHWARVALEDWININVELISKTPKNQMTTDRTKIIYKLILQYGIDSKKDFYDKMRI